MPEPNVLAVKYPMLHHLHRPPERKPPTEQHSHGDQHRPVTAESAMALARQRAWIYRGLGQQGACHQFWATTVQ